MRWALRGGAPSALACALTIIACENNAGAPPAARLDGAVEGGVIFIPPVGRRDAGRRPDGAVDAGDIDGGGIARGCVDLASSDRDNTIDAPGLDFEPTRAFAYWDTSVCAPATLIVGLSDSDSCLPNQGHRLLFRFNAAAIEDMRLHVGPNEVDPLTLTTSIAYVRAAPLEPADTWGLCGVGNGLITFEAIGTLKNDAMRASFDLTLADCREPLTSEAVRIRGTFDVDIADFFADVCD